MGNWQIEIAFEVFNLLDLLAESELLLSLTGYFPTLRLNLLLLGFDLFLSAENIRLNVNLQALDGLFVFLEGILFFLDNFLQILQLGLALLFYFHNYLRVVHRLTLLVVDLNASRLDSVVRWFPVLFFLL